MRVKIVRELVREGGWLRCEEELVHVRYGFHRTALLLWKRKQTTFG